MTGASGKLVPGTVVEPACLLACRELPRMPPSPRPISVCHQRSSTSHSRAHARSHTHMPASRHLLSPICCALLGASRGDRAHRSAPHAATGRIVRRARARGAGRAGARFAPRSESYSGITPAPAFSRPWRKAMSWLALASKTVVAFIFCFLFSKKNSHKDRQTGGVVRQEARRPP